MPNRSLAETMNALGTLLDDFDEIIRIANAKYRDYKPEDLIELSKRAQAACTYDHMIAEAERRFLDRKHAKFLEIRQQKLWFFEDIDIAIRFKKVDEDGRTENYPTKQAIDFDIGNELPGLPMPPVRLTAGYLLDPTGVEIIRAQVSRPIGRKKILWCAAIVPEGERENDKVIWKDVTKQRSF